MATVPATAAIAVIAIVTSLLLLLLLLRIIPSARSVTYCLHKSLRWLDDRCHAHQIYKIPRFDDSNRENPIYHKSVTYLNSLLPSLDRCECANVFSSGRKPNDFFLQLHPERPIRDSYLGSRLSWTLTSGPSSSLLSLRIRRCDRHRVLRPYLHHVQAIADGIDLRRKELKLFYIGSRGWNSVPLTHPSTLDTIAIDGELKSRVKSDLESFLKGKSYYARLGRVWKRSYLLYGPTGTGKSTFAAAMAKFLNYDIYDLDLSAVSANELKSLLIRTSPRSVILVEDLDRHVPSSSMLNFMDGVFSCCGDERVMVFTMREGKEAVDVDPAVFRPGRLDVQLHFPLCDFTVFKSLASSYLGLKDHKLYPQVEEEFQNGGKLSPAEVGEIMIANRGSPSRAIKTVIGALHQSSSARMFFSGSFRKSTRSGSGSGSVEDAEACDGPKLVFGKGPATVRELKNLYGLIRTRGTGSRKDGTMSVEMAAAAAATANAAAAADVANYLDRSYEWANLTT